MGQEALPGHTVVRMPQANVGAYRGLSIVILKNRDAELLPDYGLRAVGGDQ